MIHSFRSRGLELFYTTGSTRRLAVQNTARVTMVLTALHAATRPSDMNLPGLFYHDLGHRRPNCYSVRVTGNWRITFRWTEEGPADVDLEDYH